MTDHVVGGLCLQFIFTITALLIFCSYTVNRQTTSFNALHKVNRINIDIHSHICARNDFPSGIVRLNMPK